VKLSQASVTPVRATAAVSDVGRHHAPVQGASEEFRRQHCAGEYGSSREKAGTIE